MLSSEHEAEVTTVLSSRQYGSFSVPELGLSTYEQLKSDPAKCRGFCKSFYHSAKNGLLNTATYEVEPIKETENPVRYKIKPKSLNVPAYPPETLLREASIPQVLQRLGDLLTAGTRSAPGG